MKKLKLITLLVTACVLSTSVKAERSNFEDLAKKFNGTYIQKESIPLTVDEAVYFALPGENKSIVENVLLIQSNFKFKNYEKKDRNKYEFILFDGMIAVNSSDGRYLYKLNNVEISQDLIDEFGKSTIIDSYGVGLYLLDVEKTKVLFNKSEIEKSFLGSNLKHFSKHLGKMKNALYDCGCNEYTVACSCGQGSTSCSVTCGSGSYACCEQGVFTPSCNCIKKGPDQ